MTLIPLELKTAAGSVLHIPAAVITGFACNPRGEINSLRIVNAWHNNELLAPSQLPTTLRFPVVFGFVFFGEKPRMNKIIPYEEFGEPKHFKDRGLTAYT
jgi:hypothetical protein